MQNDELLQRIRKNIARARELDVDREERISDAEFIRLGGKYQWDAHAVRGRVDASGILERPMLTVNRALQYRNITANELRQATPSMQVRPATSGADERTAAVINGILREAQSKSGADKAYDNAMEWALDTGIGYFRIGLEYLNPLDMDPAIVVKTIFDPDLVLYDPDSMEPDGSDAQWAAEESVIGAGDLRKDDPDYHGGLDPGSEHQIRTAYYELVETPAEIVEYEDKSTGYADATPPVGKTILRRRKSVRKVCKWYEFVGDTLVGEGELPIRFIPIIPVVGYLTMLRGKKRMKGVVRDVRDPAKMYNYWLSTETELLALQPKAPYLIPNGAIRGFEKSWGQANTVPQPYLMYNSIDEEGQPVSRPQREQFAPPPTGFIQAKQGVIADIEATFGRYAASVGDNPNQQSGKAILGLQHQATLGSYHFLDNLTKSITHASQICVDLIVALYNREGTRITREEDGATSVVQLRPGVSTGDGVDLSVGGYTVIPASGSDFITRRQESTESMLALVQSFPTLMQVAGDLLVKNFDWPGADLIAARMKKMLPPQLQQLEQDPSQGKTMEEMEAHPAHQAFMQATEQAQQMAQQMEQVSQHAQQLQRQLDDKQSFEAAKLALEDQKIQIERFRAETERMAKLKADAFGEEREAEFAMRADAHEREQDRLDARLQMEIEKHRRPPPEPTPPVEKTVIEPPRISRRSIVRDRSGAPIGVQEGEKFRKIVLDANDRISGIE